jgi:hypothetical protein
VRTSTVGRGGVADAAEGGLSVPVGPLLRDELEVGVVLGRLSAEGEEPLAAATCRIATGSDDEALQPVATQVSAVTAANATRRTGLVAPTRST